MSSSVQPHHYHHLLERKRVSVAIRIPQGISSVQSPPIPSHPPALEIYWQFCCRI